ncbi:heavy metal translocating P-type ATPase [Helicobacter sp. 11S02629-2]|uniref:heavy metal translocating P-type ATPase n=1 Tax=Helicobacter sp. 11S02629-2 TaxID=1476195 RepID=UPI000BA51B0A|nr:heavy metal translocating P-type ATPase [Helicobacter sp. 11S02629-2]PAF44373.1 copper-translocating P-type ATPase [Helicobacter sp. 11S02629-2]
MKCDHCKLDFPESSLHKVVINGKECHFCCNGCEFVYNLLQDNNLESFYDKLGEKTLKPVNRDDAKDSVYDSPSFLKRYVKELDPNLYEVSFILEDIMCAACVWLNEQYLSGLKGINSVNINYTNHKAKVTYDPNVITLKEIVQSIRNIGYKPIFFDSTNTPKLKNDYARLVVAVFCAMNVMWINVGQYIGFFTGIDQNSRDILNFASFILGSFCLFFGGSKFYKNAYYGLKRNMIGMDLLVITGTTIVYIYSIYAWLFRQGETYFDSISMIILFVLGSKFLESLASKSMGDSLDKLTSILPSLARKEDGSEISPDLIKKGDILMLLPGDILPVDAVLKSPNASFDTSLVTGESLPISLKKGDVLLSGYNALDTNILYEATTTFQDSSASRLAKLLESSQFKRPQIANFALRFSGKFSKIVLTLAAISFCVYFFLLKDGFNHSLLIAVSVIIIACPCALALATPIAAVVGLNLGFKHKILFTEASFLETLAKVTHVVFDKTGTLTNGRPEVTNSYFDESLKVSKHTLKDILKHNTHLVSQTVYEFLDSKVESNSYEEGKFDIKYIAGKGFYASNDSLSFACGSDSFMSELGLELENKTSSITFNMALKTKEGYKLCARFFLLDTLKDGAKELMDYLKAQHKTCILLSGDRLEVAKDIAAKVGITEVFSNQTPLSKAEFVKDLVSKGHIVSMIGDGLNDALALSYAHVGISMGSGAQTSIKESKIIILDDSLKTLRKAFMIAKASISKIKQNLLMSLVYNVIALPVAVLGFVIPLFAALFMSISSISVVLNSLRLNSLFKKEERLEAKSKQL